MNKILVAIDFSVNSKKTIRFAIQLAAQTKAEIIFYHMVNMITPVSDVAWNYAYYSQFQEEDIQLYKKQLEKLVKSVYTDKLPSRVKYLCDCEMGNNVGDQIISYAKKHNINFICVGARGTNTIAKLFGNVAMHLIFNSPIPVFVIPKNYRLKVLSDICYASDMENIEIEIKKVLELSKKIKAKIEVLHFDYEINLLKNHEKLISIAQKHETKGVKFQFEKMNALYPLNDNLSKVIRSIKTNLVVLFTKQNRKWFDRLFGESQSAELSFVTKTPLLIYRKTKK